MDGEQTEYIWGVVDMITDTDMPDFRNKTAIHSINGSCMVIPREGDKLRFYIQLEGKDVINAASGRVDKSKMGPERLLEVARRSFYPYTIKTPKAFDWWTIYISNSFFFSITTDLTPSFSRSASCIQVLR